MEAIDLVSKKDKMMDFFSEHGEELLSGEEAINIEKLKDIRDYTHEGERIKLVEYLLRMKSGEGKVVYGFISSKPDSYKVSNRLAFLETLKKAGFDRGKYQVPNILKYFPDMNLIIREGIEGSTLKDYLREQNEAVVSEGVKEAGLWLDRFQKVDYKDKSRFKPGYKIDEVEFEGYKRAMKDFLKKNDYKQVVLILDDILEHTTAIYGSSEMKLIHGDYQPQNIFFDPERKIITVMDFDWGALSDPLSDVGDFLIQFDYHASKVMSAQEIKNNKLSFIENYLEDALVEENDVAFGVNRFQARFALQRAAFNIQFLISKEKSAKKKAIYEEEARSLIDRAIGFYEIKNKILI